MPFASRSQPKPYYFKNYQVYQGLSSNIITVINQDRKGFMWFGSRNGLNRFDGTAFKVFRNKPGDLNSIGSNSIFSLYEDARERLWVGTYKGIYLFNPQTESFSLLRGLPAGEVRYIRGDGNQHIWFISDLKLYRYDEQTGEITFFPFPKDQVITLSLAVDRTVWIATKRGLVCRFDASKKRFIPYMLSTVNEGRMFSTIQEILPIADTALMIGTMNQTVLFNFRKNRLSPILSGRYYINDVHVHTIFRQTNGEFWLGTEAGLYTFNLGGRTFNRVQKQYTNPYTITDNIVSAIFRDREGGTWLGTYFGGINYYSTQYNTFRKYFPEPGVNSLSGNIIHEICKDNSGNLWVGTEDAGLNKINLRTGQITRFRPDSLAGSIAYHNLHGLVVDGNKLWIGTYEHGLDVMDLRTQKVIKHYESNRGRHPFNGNFIVTLYRTRSGSLLVGTWNGLFRHNSRTDDFTALPFFDSPIQSIQEDDKGTLWVSSYGGGVYYQNERTGEKGHWVAGHGKTGGLISNYVNHLFLDSKHRWWFCTEAGLSSYDKRTGRFTNFTVEDGLPDNQVFRILEDGQGLLWISTAKGLSKFDPASKEFESFYTPNGLPTDQFNYNSAFKDSDGTMYFGTVKGLISFQPEKFFKNNYIPPVYLTGLQVNNKELDITKTGPLKRSVTYTHSLTLPYDSANLTIDAAALSYVLPEMNRYQYCMNGVDKTWIHLKKNRKIYYTNLPPGNYTFRIKGSTSEGIWNKNAAVLYINILPPYWLTWWAYILYALVAMAIAYTILRYYHLAVSEKNKRKIETIEINTEREIYNAKIEFFTNVAHEIRTPLTLIKMPLDKLLSQPIHQQEVNDNLNMIKKNTNRLIDLTNQLLDFRKAEANKFSLTFSKTDINEVLTDVYAVFKPTAEIKQLDFRMVLPRIILFAYVDHEALKKILSNLFNNAIKYAQGQVIVKLMPFSSEDSIFTIEIRNDGYLIPNAYREKIFEPFFRLKETEKEAGTGIGLPLSRSLAQLHQGSLQLKENEEGLNVFALTLPIHQEVEIDFTDHGTAIADGTAEEPGFQGEAYPDGPSILLVEDNKEILHYIQKELSHRYRVHKAHNGAEALTLLARENVQLVVSDIMMPVMDGIALCKQMKTELAFSHIPIILLTAKNSLHAKIEGLEVGADAYIEKPFAFEYLLAQINSLLTNRNIVKDYFARSPLTHIKGIAVSKADKDFLEHLNELIYANITNLDLDVDQLSNMMNMSRPTLYRKIKGLSDMTPNELINLSRLKKAAELLAEGNYKINEVANMVGYSLPSNFSRDFQRQFRVSPSQYIQSLKDQPKEEI